MPSGPFNRAAAASSRTLDNREKISLSSLQLFGYKQSTQPPWISSQASARKAAGNCSYCFFSNPSFANILAAAAAPTSSGPMYRRTSTARTTSGIRSWRVSLRLSLLSNVFCFLFFRFRYARRVLTRSSSAVGRWQKGRDLQWYAKSQDQDGDDDAGLTPEEKARQERAEEIRRVKQAEQEALGKALGYEVNPEGPLGSGAGAGTGANAVGVTKRDVPERRDAENEDRGKRREERRERRRHDRHGEERERKHKHRRRRSPSSSRSRSRSRDAARDRRDREDRRYRRHRSPSRSRSRSRSRDDRREKRSRNDYDRERDDRRDRGHEYYDHERDSTNIKAEVKRQRSRDRERNPQGYERRRERSRGFDDDNGWDKRGSRYERRGSRDGPRRRRSRSP